jgi:hypothetical protein
MSARPELAGLRIADAPESWAAAGFSIEGGELALGGIRLRFGASGAGIASWTLRHVDPQTTSIDGLATAVTGDPAVLEPERPHPNGALGIDQVVVTTPDFDRTAAALERGGMALRRIRDAGGMRQGFRRLGPAILEVVETPPVPAGPARFWGLVVTVGDLAALPERLGADLGQVRPAVQPGRHIATLRASAGLSPRVAFMDPEPAV